MFTKCSQNFFSPSLLDKLHYIIFLMDSLKLRMHKFGHITTINIGLLILVMILIMMTLIINKT